MIIARLALVRVKDCTQDFADLMEEKKSVTLRDLLAGVTGAAAGA